MDSDTNVVNVWVLPDFEGEEGKEDPWDSKSRTGCAGVTHAGPHPTIVREGRLLSLQYLRQQILPRGPEPDEPGGRQDDVQHTPRKHPWWNHTCFLLHFNCQSKNEPPCSLRCEKRLFALEHFALNDERKGDARKKKHFLWNKYIKVSLFFLLSEDFCHSYKFQAA